MHNIQQTAYFFIPQQTFQNNVATGAFSPFYHMYVIGMYNLFQMEVNPERIISSIRVTSIDSLFSSGSGGKG